MSTTPRPFSSYHVSARHKNNPATYPTDENLCPYKNLHMNIYRSFIHNYQKLEITKKVGRIWNLSEWMQELMQENELARGTEQMGETWYEYLASSRQKMMDEGRGGDEFRRHS